MGYVMRDLVVKIRGDIDAALVAVAAKHGLASLKCGGGTIGSSNFMLKVEGVMGGGKTPEAERYEINAKMLRLKPIGSVFVSGNRTYQITGLNKTGSKILADRAPDGKTFLFPTSYAQVAE
jgi:hypothetical protein